jgi:hypothetical protein
VEHEIISPSRNNNCGTSSTADSVAMNMILEGDRIKMARTNDQEVNLHGLPVFRIEDIEKIQVDLFGS